MIVPKNPQLHHRRSLRIKGQDYTAPGAYFITITSHQNHEIFGDFTEEKMAYSSIGEIAKAELVRLEQRFSNIQLDTFVIMPNHIHFILILSENGFTLRPTKEIPIEKFGKPVPGSIPTIVRSLKSAITNLARKKRLISKDPIFHKNYFEHIIRNDQDWQNCRDYIRINPDRWLDEHSNPLR